MTFPLRVLQAEGVLSALDRQFAEALLRLAHADDPMLSAALALTSHQTQGGHVCVKLSEFAERPIVDEAGAEVLVDERPARWPALAPWLASLRSSPLVSSGETRAPLVLDADTRLYLYRYWEHERRVATLLKERLSLSSDTIDHELLTDGLSRLFGAAREADAQRDACLIALSARLCAIVGGPGTGKTATVARLLALLVEQSLKAHGHAPHALLLAPTGKAAARLADSIRAAKTKLDCAPAVLAGISERASTIHRALGSVRGSATQFYHHAGHPLIADIVLVDEASMVDVALMRRLLEATPKNARVILLGDRHQLASVAAGSVLADICSSDRHPGYATPLVERVRELSGTTLSARNSPTLGIVDSVALLDKSYRFSETSSIARFARAVNAGDAARALELFQLPSGGRALGDDNQTRELLHVSGDDESLLLALERQTVAAYRKQQPSQDPVRLLQRLNEFRVLCAHRAGPLGVVNVNRRLESALARAGLLRPHGQWYLGRPILITSNDHELNLFNGDVGLILRDTNGALRAMFDVGGGAIRALSPARLPPHETVFAISIHKSQGSEFDDVAIVLPRPGSPLLTRQLIYTAVTRARRHATLYGDTQSILLGIAQPALRASGLGALLHPA